MIPPLDFARQTGMIDNLVVYPENMKKDLNKLNDLVFLHCPALELHTFSGISRESTIFERVFT